MFFLRVDRRAQRITTYQPAVCVLEDRVVPTSLRGFGPPIPPPSAATHLMVIVPPNVQEGTPTSVIVEALNGKNQLATSYRGNVQIALGTPDPTATLPTGFTFSAGDKGKHTLQITFETPGPQTVLATSGGLAAQAPLTVNSVVTHFAVYAVSQAIAGEPMEVQVVALDANNNIAADYRGTVQFTNTDVFAPQLDDYTFQAADNGSHIFAVSFATVGEQTLTVADAAHHAIVGAVSVNVSPSVDLWSPWMYSLYGGWGYGYGWLL
jgi:hypothetical protein